MAAAAAGKAEKKDGKGDKGGAVDAETAARRKSSIEAAKKLEWKFAQRADATDLVARGIVGEEYEEVIKGNKDATEAEKEHDKHMHDASAKIDKVFKMDLRPSADDVEDRGIAPHGSLVSEHGHEYDDAVKKAQNEKDAAKEKLAAKFEQRMKPDEAIARHIIDEDALNKDYDAIKDEHKSDKAKIADKLNRNIGQRPDPKEMVARGIAEDEKEFFEDYDKVEQAKKQEKEDHVKTLKDWKRPSPQDVAKKGVLNKDEVPPTDKK